MNHDDLTELQQDLDNAKHVVFLTGAGVSTHSGIPDYRSKNGIYNGVQESPETILSESTLYNRPEFFYHFVMDNMYFPDAKPNLIHEKIAQICNKKGDLITQNIDRLDTKAGNEHVTEFHGNLYNIYCTKVISQFPMMNTPRATFIKTAAELFVQELCFTGNQSIPKR